MNLYKKINNNEVYVIAEMSANHGGRLDTALQIVREVAEAGADCLKIQTYTADSMTIDCESKYFQIHGGLWDGYNLYKLYEYASTPCEWVRAIKSECEKYGIDFLSTPFDKITVDFLEDCGVEFYKIASFELVDIPLIEYTASKHKPMIISCGMASPDEIQDAVDVCKVTGNEQIVLLKCCSEYPAPWNDMKLGNIPDMASRFKLPIGLSDHSAGSLGAVVGVALGAVVVEKHVMIKGVKSADSDFSMTMEEFKAMVSDVRNAKMMMKGPDYNLTDGEQGQLVFRRSLFAVNDIKAGEEFSEENVRSIRPGNGIKPKYYYELIGKKSYRNIKYGEPIVDGDLRETPDTP